MTDPDEKATKARTRMLRIRVSDAEYETLNRKAEQASLSLSALVRDHISRVTVRNREDEKRRLMMLNRINANLNMIARHCNIHQSASDATQVIAHLSAIDREVKRIVTMMDKS